VSEPAARLCEELLALTRRFQAEIQAGDESGMAAFVERRTALAAAILASPEATSPEIVEALAACDRELIALLRGCQHEILQRLAGLAVGRRTLRAYLDGSPAPPSYIERLG
jgi:hypothetical protein